MTDRLISAFKRVVAPKDCHAFSIVPVLIQSRPSEYEAIIELVRQVGFDLEDG